MRTTLSLNGHWQISESSDSEKPGRYERLAPVPGLVSLAEPAFPGTRATDRPTLGEKERHLPVADPLRDYFWYRREFTLDAVPARVRLRVAKAQFGLRVLVNGRVAGGRLSCFSAALIDITDFVRPGRNEVVLRVGAHPVMLPPEYPSGSDQEKQIWLPGVYDDVTLWLSDDPAIAAIEVAPDLGASCAKLRAVVRNASTVPSMFKPRVIIREALGGREVSRWEGTAARLVAGEEQTITCTVPLASPRLWSPDSPFLYELEFCSGGDTQRVRFGMRSFRFDTPTRRAYLNDQIIFLRGSNITLHRFFEDSLCGALPWDRDWVRRLLQEWPKKLGWNCFRFCIGPVPDFWLDLADEAGLIIENEYFLWGRRASWDINRIREDVEAWMADCANHPSVGWWSLSNETMSDDLESLIAPLRARDLSHRAWNNGYHLPEGPDDPIDDHHYLVYDKPGCDRVQWSFEQFACTTGAKSINSPKPSSHATVLNEYGWLWLLRNGQPTRLTEGVYKVLQPGGASAEERIALYAELIGHESRYFRIHRNYAGVLHFTYLTADHPAAYTGDLWRDVVTLEMWPAYEEAFRNAFQPVCAHLPQVVWRLIAGASEAIPIALINDEPRPVGGELLLRIVDAAGRERSCCRRAWSLPASGQHTWCLKPDFPIEPGLYRIETEVTWDGTKAACSSSRLEIVAAGGTSY